MEYNKYMEISQVLKQIGLNEKQASVYLALLELGTATVHPISTKAGIKRPTTYLILDELQQKGMVSVVPRAKKALYAAESPEKLITDLNKKQELVKRFMPNMLALYNAKKDKPEVLLFEGKEAVAEVYERILKAKQVDFFCTIADIATTFPDYPVKIMRTAMQGNMKFRELLSQNRGDIEYAKKMEHGENYQHRFLPTGMKLLTDNVLFDGRVVFFSYQPYIFAVQISSRGIYESLRALFDTAWLASEPFEKLAN